MSVDNDLYDQAAAGWWDERGPMYALHPRANPARLEYLLGVLEATREPGVPASGGGDNLGGLRVLDLGCGGGFLSEELALRGAAVSGLDPAGLLVEAARAHARERGVSVDYRVGVGEALPYAEASFDAVCCMDALEHVSNLPAVIREVARVLTPGGVFVFDTINRTWRSWLVVVLLLQELPWTSVAPRRLHDWRMFVRPEELRRAMGLHGLVCRETVGIGPTVGLAGLAWLLRRCKRGEITPAETLRHARVRLGSDTSVSYLGHARKSVEGGAIPRPSGSSAGPSEPAPQH